MADVNFEAISSSKTVESAVEDQAPPRSPASSEASFNNICEKLGIAVQNNKRDGPSSNAGSSSGGEDGEGSQQRTSPRKNAKVDYGSTAGRRKKHAKTSAAVGTGGSGASGGTVDTSKISSAPPSLEALGKPKQKTKTKQPTANTKAATTTTNLKPPASKKRGGGFSVEETMDLLLCIEEVVPIGPAQWDRVCDLHASKWSSQCRNVDSIRRKFKKLASEKVPTGDPNCPEEVRSAKRIYRDIEAKMDAAEEMDDYELGLPADDDDGDDSADKATNVTTTVESPNPLRRMRTPRSTPGEGAGGDSIMQVMMAKMMEDGKAREEREERRQQDRQLEERRYQEERSNRERLEREEKERRDRRDDEDKKRSDMMTMMMMNIMSKMNGGDKEDGKDKAT
jgi:hypothetical protein